MSRLRVVFWSLPVLAACHTGAPHPAPAVPDTGLIGRDIRYLASDALEGRLTGTPGNDSAAAYIARRFVSLGLEPLADPSACGARARCVAGYEQHFVARSVVAAHEGLPAAMPTQNVAALIPGTDPVLRHEYVVIGGHFDHLGRSSFGALDPDKPNAIHNGADDNASGTAAVMELARLFRSHPAKRSIVAVTFSGEELGLLGSEYFVAHSPVPLDSVEAMVNFDMVGRLRNDKLIIYGVATATELKSILESDNAAPAFKIAPIGDGFGPSDQSSFYARNLPVLHFFTDSHEDYHRASDHADKINLPGEARVIAYAERVIRTIANEPGRLTFVRAPVVATSRSPYTSDGVQPYLGSVPDMGATDVEGVRLSGVRPGSPADSAGLKEGDVVVELDGKPVKDLQTYSDALYVHRPGDKVDVVVLRDGKRVKVAVTLGRRGG